MPEGLNSNLNLNEGAPPRVRPAMGEWGPTEVPNTRTKKRHRWFAIAGLVVVLAVVVTYGYYMWTLLR
ncbi:hypothetical protein [Propionicimonas sp.]|uniref:hypothetical protein n=1 Tax=Propionicimonas sp. TaxID=1955623 RepID=UPI00182A4EA9|nr:hypothetical protein [Propionicimonas sp.]MBU3977436.1 hypothetical protein [Actinomycetota bacterium]MBA3021360.1 hypothetical protein [Propionicimonas sp.]MBU3985946.1 hypothetical protein [Actinomycetota bacterium]MBU4008731.1 hypothetical protein [Actinomycetota bacterium]MBU4066119.1 hypothetical protein [Actinomycetota bacterium]